MMAQKQITVDVMEQITVDVMEADVIRRSHSFPDPPPPLPPCLRTRSISAHQTKRRASQSTSTCPAPGCNGVDIIHHFAPFRPARFRQRHHPRHHPRARIVRSILRRSVLRPDWRI